MKLVFIYGPPASGKLTVAEKLSGLTGVPLFHNHLSRDIVKDIYPEDLDAHYALVDKIRIDVFEYCAANNTDLIFTFVYGGKEDDETVKTYARSVEAKGGEVSYVELTASRQDLLDRVSNDSRKRFKKLSDPGILSELTQSMGIYAIPFVDALKINTSELEPEESARLIATKLNLRSRPSQPRNE